MMKRHIGLGEGTLYYCSGMVWHRASGTRIFKVRHNWGWRCQSGTIYRSKNDTTRYNKSSASDQAMKEVTKLVKFYKEKGEEVSLTITGHSLGGALPLLNGYEAASNIKDRMHLFISRVICFMMSSESHIFGINWPTKD